MSHTPSRQTASLSPITLRIADACRITGIGRSKFYELIKAGEIDVIKVGAITLVPMTSIQALLERGRSAMGEGAFSDRLRAVMHPFVANAILTAALAKVPDEGKRDLASSNADRRAKAEDALVECLVAAVYEAGIEITGRVD
ncbi:helix-turn-helix domain-containing protein [Sphingosinithalassobacter portus]|uniref:helix-turn-helix domain-containing protein n=1 Tax=Stakelama portus TaxID=2676234 RepID=UPI0018757C1F